MTGRRKRGSRGGRPLGFDPVAYRGRNVVERCFDRLMNRRGLATRYDRHALVFRGGLVLAAFLLWVRRPSATRPRGTSCSPSGRATARSPRRPHCPARSLQPCCGRQTLNRSEKLNVMWGGSPSGHPEKRIDIMGSAVSAGALKKMLAAVSIAASLTAMSACSSEPAPQPAPQPLVAAPADDPSTRTPDKVDCKDDRRNKREFTHVLFHNRGHDDQVGTELCLANSGTYKLNGDQVVTEIDSGRNKVEWRHGNAIDPTPPLGDGKVNHTVLFENPLGVQEIIMNP